MMLEALCCEARLFVQCHVYFQGLVSGVHTNTPPAPVHVIDKITTFKPGTGLGSRADITTIGVTGKEQHDQIPGSNFSITCDISTSNIYHSALITQPISSIDVRFSLPIQIQDLPRCPYSDLTLHKPRRR